MPARNLGLWLLWAALLAVLPWLWTGHAALNMLSQMGIAVVACLSYAVLLGQGGMLSFGHAVYTGLGAYAAMHWMLRVQDMGWTMPTPWLPLVGGVGGLLVAATLGYLNSRRAGTAFAMISLGLGELLYALALRFADGFGGVAGLSANRVTPPNALGLTWGPAIEVYYLIVAYTLLSMAVVDVLRRGPLGLALRAVRDNPLRASALGYNPAQVRYWGLLLSGTLAGVAGGLWAVLFEFVTPEVLSPVRSGAYLVFTYVGGLAGLAGPVLGGVLMVLSVNWLSSLTGAWMLYVGLLFVWVVRFTPHGVVGWVATGWQLWQQQGFQGVVGLVVRAWPWLVGVACVLCALVAAVEMAFHRQVNAALGPVMQGWWGRMDVSTAPPWLLVLALAAVGVALCWVGARRRVLA
jgi:branched-chain amino acid transport system permease protein